ncbi:hypothetical protein [Pararhodobacter zhoushanensis]|uniref:Uncharacterized protein n=1 Tax=Pararhodobacter zhoushanensis TaxID=2479545 RepID=A0ABT3GZR3_9RHOB|nr:hypothetical protein [Pararhodobacter zhoushanensis]MCW1933007.1 hypothetical protein [Pararhodobacter zhoushanensis]
MVCVVTLWPVLAAFGSLLPAAALGLPFSPLEARKAARSTWHRSAFQLLVFALGLGVAFLAAVGWSSPVFGPEPMLTDDALSWLNHRAPSAQMVIVAAVAMATVAPIGVLKVAILSRAFLRETPAT